MATLLANSIPFGSKNDERAFCYWLDNIPAVTGYELVSRCSKFTWLSR